MVDAEDKKALLSKDESDEEGDLSTIKQQKQSQPQQPPLLHQPSAVLPSNGMTQDQAQAQLLNTPPRNDAKIHSYTSTLHARY